MHRPIVTSAGHPRAGQRIARQMCHISTFTLPQQCVWTTIIGKNDSLCNINHDRFQEKTVVVLPTALAVHTGWGL